MSRMCLPYLRFGYSHSDTGSRMCKREGRVIQIGFTARAREHGKWLYLASQLVLKSPNISVTLKASLNLDCIQSYPITTRPNTLCWPLPSNYLIKKLVVPFHFYPFVQFAAQHEKGTLISLKLVFSSSPVRPPWSHPKFGMHPVIQSRQDTTKCVGHSIGIDQLFSKLLSSLKYLRSYTNTSLNLNKCTSIQLF